MRDSTADRDLLVFVALEAAAPPLTHYRMTVSLEGRLVTRGTIATFLADAYTVRARFARDDEGTTIAIAVRSDLHPRTSFDAPPWVCGYD